MLRLLISSVTSLMLSVYIAAVLLLVAEVTALEVEAGEVAAAVVAVVIDFKQRKAPTIRSELL